MSNSTFTIKRGASGAVMTVTLRDEDGVVDLTGFTGVTVTASMGDDSPVMAALAMAFAADRTTGIVSYAFTPTTSDIEPGTYDLEFEGTDASGDKHVFPTNKNVPYGKLVVQKRV